jgi:DHA3 family tetracycline resistance protein-like MFS transporter
VYRLDASRLFVIMGGANAFLRGTMYLVITVYYVLAVHMNPLQLVLVGTVLEVSYFLFQIPTGLFADAVGRRLSIILGWAIAGTSFAVEGLVPNVAVILAAQGVLGAGEAFIDGAESAWLADEVGGEQFGHVMLRASQFGQILSAVGIVFAAALGSLRLSAPIVVGGAGMALMSVFFALAMPEAGFRPAAREGRSALGAMWRTLGSGVRLVRGSTVLLIILGVELFTGAGSEGFDRLWEAHLIRDIHLPAVGSFRPVVWFAAIAISESAVVFAANRLLQHRLTRLTQNRRAMARMLAILNVVDVVCIVGFALAGSFVLALTALLLRACTFGPAGLLRSVWYNQNITDSSVRATVMSMTGQTNALGQWVGGPAVGFLGNAVTLGAAITATGVVRSPISLLYGLSTRRGEPVAALQERDSA